MNIQRILCPVDLYSDYCAVNVVASALAAAYQAELIYLHISQPIAPYGSGYAYVDVMHEAEEELELIKQISPIGDRDIPHQHEVKLGVPADAIVQFAKDHAVDLIVLGTHGRKGVNRVLMGSVAEAVVRRADCPVLTIKVPAEVTA